MTGKVTGDGSRQLAETVKVWLLTKQVALGVLVDDEIEEISYSGYERQTLELEVYERLPDVFALLGNVQFPKNTSAGGALFQVVYLIDDLNEITHTYEYEEERSIPPNGRPRWTIRFFV
jgi:hypothetical protein